MTGREELVAEGEGAIAALAAQYQAAVGMVVDVVRTATGVDLTPSVRPPIMDATQEQLLVASHRARSALAAMDVVLKVHWGDSTTLGELLRDDYWSDEDRERIVDHLIRAGLS